MRPDDILFWSVLGFIGVQRIAELVVVRFNQAYLFARGAVPARPDGFWAIFAVHASLFVLFPLEWFLAPWAGLGPVTAVSLSIAAAAMALHYWAAASLGRFYTVRVLRLGGARLVRRGPYRWLRHPIYVAVAIEVFAFPLAFGCYAAAVGLGVPNLLALTHRIRIEERHLGLAPRSPPLPR